MFASGIGQGDAPAAFLADVSRSSTDTRSPLAKDADGNHLILVSRVEVTQVEDMYDSRGRLCRKTRRPFEVLDRRSEFILLATVMSECRGRERRQARGEIMDLAVGDQDRAADARRGTSRNALSTAREPRSVRFVRCRGRRPRRCALRIAGSAPAATEGPALRCRSGPCDRRYPACAAYRR